MRIQVEVPTLQTAGESLQGNVSAPLIGLSGSAQAIGSQLDASVGNPGLTGASAQFCGTLLQALQNGGLIAGLLGRGLTGGAGAYAVTDQNAVSQSSGQATSVGAPENPGTLRYR
jgi:hypothetical protein